MSSPVLSWPSKNDKNEETHTKKKERKNAESNEKTNRQDTDKHRTKTEHHRMCGCTLSYKHSVRSVSVVMHYSVLLCSVDFICISQQFGLLDRVYLHLFSYEKSSLFFSLYFLLMTVFCTSKSNFIEAHFQASPSTPPP